MRSYNDDLVMSLAIACWVRDTALQENQRDVEYKKAMLGGILKSTQTFETRIPGQEGYKEKNEKELAEELKKKKDFFWIYKG